MVPHKHGRPGLQRLLPSPPTPLLPSPHLINTKRHARAQPHGPLERPPNSPLAKPTIPNCSQDNTGNDTVAGAYDQHQERSDAERNEGGLLAQPSRQHEGKRAEQHDERDGGGREVEEPAHAGL